MLPNDAQRNTPFGLIERIFRMTPITTVADLIEKLGGYAGFSQHLGLKSPANARVMRQRGRIPMRYWDDVVLAASHKDLPGITHGFLKRLHAAPQPSKVASSRCGKTVSGDARQAEAA